MAKMEVYIWSVPVIFMCSISFLFFLGYIGRRVIQYSFIRAVGNVFGRFWEKRRSIDKVGFEMWFQIGRLFA